MTDREKLEKVRAEIERRYKYNKEHENDWAGTFHYWQMREDEEILSFIDSMQKEPVSGLDNGDMPIERWKQAVKAASNQRNYRSSKGLTETRDDYFVDGVQWADEHPKEEPVSEDLGEYINELSKQFPEVSFAKLSRIAVRVAKWQKEQMIANTADAMIGLPYENKDGGYTHLIDVSRPLPVGNNKIAIIFKED